jgi:hypothetical protein
METVSLSTVNHFVLKKQHLADDSKLNDPVLIAKDIGGLHGTSATGPYLSLLARSNSFQREDLAVEMSKKKNLARIRYVRNTIYILPKDFIPVAYAATSQMAEVTAARFSKYLGITPTQYARISNKILKILRGRGLTTREIKQKLRTAINIAPIVNLMCDKGLLVRSLPREGWKSTQHAYYLFKDYYPDLNLTVYDEKDARREIVKQYILSFGPVSEKDVGWWTGFPKPQVKEILKDLDEEISSVEIPELEGGYIIHSSEEDDGSIVGIWDLQEPLVKIFYMTAVEKDVRKKIRSKVSDVGKFITEKPVHVKVCDSMVPLPKRTAGSFQSPLRDC